MNQSTAVWLSGLTARICWNLMLECQLHGGRDICLFPYLFISGCRIVIGTQQTVHIPWIHVSAIVITAVPLQDGNCYFSHFTREEAEAWKGTLSLPGSRSPEVRVKAWIQISGLLARCFFSLTYVSTREVHEVFVNPLNYHWYFLYYLLIKN